MVRALRAFVRVQKEHEEKACAALAGQRLGLCEDRVCVADNPVEQGVNKQTAVKMADGEEVSVRDQQRLVPAALCVRIDEVPGAVLVDREAPSAGLGLEDLRADDFTEFDAAQQVIGHRREQHDVAGPNAPAIVPKADEHLLESVAADAIVQDVDAIAIGRGQQIEVGVVVGDAIAEGERRNCAEYPGPALPGTGCAYTQVFPGYLEL